jgi:hypothetical protein
VRWQISTPGKFSRPVTAAGGVVIAEWPDGSLKGFDADRGHEMWNVSLPGDRCEVRHLSGAGSLLAVSLTCNHQQYVTAVDPLTGTELWRQAMPNLAQETEDEPLTYIRAAGGALAIRDVTGGFQLLDHSGKRLPIPQMTEVEPANMVANSEVAIVPNQDQLTAIDLSNGRVRWTIPVTVQSLIIADDNVYALGKLPDPMMQTALYTIDIVTGTVTQSLTPLIGNAAYDTIAAIHRGNLLLHDLIDASWHLTAYHPTSIDATVGFAGGAPASDWPSSCALLDPAAIPGSQYTATSRSTSILGRALPQPAICQYRPANTDAPIITTSIIWTGADVKQSEHLMQDLASYYADDGRGADIGTDSLFTATIGDQEPTLKIYFRVGRCIGSVSMIGDENVLAALARTAAGRLCGAAS